MEIPDCGAGVFAHRRHQQVGADDDHSGDPPLDYAEVIRMAAIAAYFALGVALASSGAWAQDPPVAQRIAPGIQLSTTIAGTVELSADQKLARAYALCRKRAPEKPAVTDAEFNACGKITAAWWAAQAAKDADRAFIEEVARGLK